MVAISFEFKLTQETDISKFLSTRQLLGRAAVQSAAQHIDPECNKNVVKAFNSLLGPFISVTPSPKRIQALQKIVDDAVALSKETAVEGVLYHWVWIPAGVEKDVDNAGYIDHLNARGGGNSVLWCTFPAFCRHYKEKGEEGDACVVKASVEFTTSDVLMGL